LSLPAFTDGDDLPPGVHLATIHEALQRFGANTARRIVISGRLKRVYQVAQATVQVARFIEFGSYVTAKPDPNDVDIFLLMEDTFDVSHLQGESRLLFDHATAQTHFGASVFWIRRLAALGGEQETVEYWQIKRDGGLRGIVEIVEESP
jgi:hypothetical protein